MPRYFIELTYCGTQYSGFQSQPNANTIQSEIEKAFGVLFRRDFQFTGSSRTDAGVHARQNYFHVDTDVHFTDKHLYNLNSILPAAIAVKSIKPVIAHAHCRFSATTRLYKYYICWQKNPFMQNISWYYPFKVNIQLLTQAADILKNYTDFTSFSKRNTQVKTFISNISISQWSFENDCLVYTVQANRFLRGMVRGLVATMLKVGRENISVEEFIAIIENKDCTKADFSADAAGLFLEQVDFPPDIFL